MLEGQRSKNRKLKSWWSLRYPWQCQVRVHHRLRSRPNRITLSWFFQPANMIENSDIEATEDECVCSLVTFDDAIPRLSWKPLVTTTTSPWMVSLAHFPVCWKSGVPASRARVLRAGDRVCTVALTPPCARNHANFWKWWAAPSRKAASDDFCVGGFVPRINGTRQSNNDEEIHNVLPEDGAFERESVARWAQKLDPYWPSCASALSNQRRCHLTPCARTSSRSTISWRCTMPCWNPVLANELYVESMNVKQGDWSRRG